MAQGLIIPVDVQAHCATSAGQSPSGFLRGTADFSAMPYYADVTDSSTLQNEGPYTSEGVLATETEANWDAGVHLHWALPDALSEGEHDANDSGATAFPPVPNRWLVTRIVTRGGSVVTDLCRSWVIESDQLSATCPHERSKGPPAVTVPVKPADFKEPSPDDAHPHPARAQAFQYLGNSYPYESWREGQGAAYLYQQTVAPYKLTAVCYGNPVFAGFYPDCSTVFGFLDKAEDLGGVLASDNLAYHVVGWYCQAAASDDPLTSAALRAAPCPTPTAADIAANNQAARDYARFLDSGPEQTTGEWSYIEDKRWLFSRPPTSNPVQYSLYNGLVEKIQWNPNDSYIPDTSAKTHVAIGNTALEAISALVSNSINDPGSEDILNALQVGALLDYRKPGRKAEYEEALHRSYFGSEQGGTLWQVSKKGGGDPTEVTLPDEQADALNKLNELQLAADGLQDRLEQLGRQIFTDWYKYQVFMRTPTEELERPQCDPLLKELHENPTNAMHLIQDEVAEFIKSGADLESQRGDIQRQVDALRASIDSDHELISVPARKFWHANDPVILMSGDLIRPILRHGGDGRLRPQDDYLECRLTTEIVAPSRPYKLGPNASLPHSGDIDALVAEAALHVSGGMPSQAPSGTKLPSAIGITTWQGNPWLPLMLEWQVGYWPAQELPYDDPSASYPTDFITAHYAFNSASTDLVPKDTRQSNASYTYTNRTILSAHSGDLLRDRIDDFLASYSDVDRALTDTLKNVQDKIKSLDVLAQALGGFNQGLLMKRQVLQLGIADPQADTLFEKKLWAQVASALKDTHYNDVAPDGENNFSPIRAGYIRWTGLSLIDVFGQIAKVSLAPPVVASSLKPTNPSLAGQGFVSLPTRFTQPSRFLFDWISASSNQVVLNNLPAASPICGWILFNHLDDSLVFYDSDGTAIGSFLLDQTETKAIWQGAPGSAGFDIPDVQSAFEGRNEHLGKFALGIQKNGGAFLKALLLTIDNGLGTILPPGAAKDPSTAVLISRPLALVRASLKLDLQGAPEMNQSWEAFKAAADARDSNQRSRAQFQNVRVPVLLGKVSDLEDGLLGYFISEDFTHFYSAAAAGQNPSITQPAPSTIFVEASGTPVEVAMLIDPRACVHATTGLVPIQTVQVPPDQISRALSRMSVTFLMAPILSGSPTAFPLPKESGGQWSWLTRDESGAWTQPPIAKVNASQTQSYSPQQLVEGWLTLTNSTRQQQ